MHTVTFAREGIRIDVADGETVREAAKRCGVRLYSGIFRLINCHGLGRCGECRVKVTDGLENLTQPTELERSFKRPSSSRDRGTFGIYEDDGERLPCQSRVRGDVTVWTRLRDGAP